LPCLFFRVQSFRSPCGRAGNFLCLCKESHQRNTPPVARPPGILPSGFASSGRVPLTGHPWPAAESARSLAPTLRAFSSAARRATGGPVWAASGNCSLRCSNSGIHAVACRRSNGNSSRQSCVETTDLSDAVQGCTDSWINAPFAVPSIAGVADQARRGAAMDRRACAAVHGRTVCATPQRREAQGSSIRTRRHGCRR